MNHILLNRDTHMSVFKGCKNLRELIHWAEVDGEKRQLVISKLYLNEKWLDEDEESLLSSLAISEVKSLGIEYQSLNALVGETMKSIISLLQDIQLTSLEQAKAFRTAPDFENNEIKGIFAKTKMLMDSLESVFQVHNRPCDFKLKHFSLWTEAEKELTGILQCILQSFELKNSSLLSELLEEAYPDALMNWEEVLEKEIVDNAGLPGIFNLNSGRINSDNGVDA